MKREQVDKIIKVGLIKNLQLFVSCSVPKVLKISHLFKIRKKKKNNDRKNNKKFLSSKIKMITSYGNPYKKVKKYRIIIILKKKSEKKGY
jgi:hypothetical protein